MRSYINFLVIGILIVPLFMVAQSDVPPSQDYRQRYDFRDDPQPRVTNFNEDLPYVKLGVGVYLPLGKLDQYFAPSPMFEFNLEWMNAYETRAVELVVQFVVPQQEQVFEYNTLTDSFTASSNLMMNGFLRLSKVIDMGTGRDLKFGAGLGIASIFVDVNEFEYAEALDYDNTNAFLANAALGYNWYFKDQSIFTVGVDLHFSQFNLEGARSSDIGSLAVIPKIAYRF